MIKSYITFDRVALLAIVIALFILLKHCGNDRDAYADRVRELDSTSLAQATLILKTGQDLWQYKEDARIARFVADSLQKIAGQYKSRASLQAAEIRQLYAELGRPWPTEVDSTCCALAVAYTHTVDSLNRADSLKDLANMQQLDLATGMVDSLNQALLASNRNYQKVDSIARKVLPAAKVRGSVWIGVEGSGGMGASAGGYIKYQSAGGKEYGIRTGLVPGGYYIGGSIGVKIKLKRR